MNFYYSDDQLGDFRVVFDYGYSPAEPDIGVHDEFEIQVLEIDTDCKGSVNILDRFSDSFVEHIAGKIEQALRNGELCN